VATCADRMRRLATGTKEGAGRQSKIRRSPPNVAPLTENWQSTRAPRKGDPEAKIASENERSLKCFRFDEGAMSIEGPAVWCASCPGCQSWIVLKENAKPVDEGGKGHGTITTLVRCPNPKCDSQDFWVEEEKMHRFRVPKGISDLGYFDESAIKKARVLPLDSFSPRRSQE